MQCQVYTEHGRNGYYTVLSGRGWEVKFERKVLIVIGKQNKTDRNDGPEKEARSRNKKRKGGMTCLNRNVVVEKRKEKVYLKNKRSKKTILTR